MTVDVKKYADEISKVLKDMDQEIANQKVKQRKLQDVKFNFSTIKELSLCLELHSRLVRRNITDTTKDAVIKLFNGEQVTGQELRKAKSLIDGLNGRYDMLTKWVDADCEQKKALYSSGKKNPPSDKTFAAAFSDLTHYEAAREFDVNSPNIYSLRSKLDVFDAYSEMLRLLK